MHYRSMAFQPITPSTKRGSKQALTVLGKLPHHQSCSRGGGWDLDGDAAVTAFLFLHTPRRKAEHMLQRFQPLSRPPQATVRGWVKHKSLIFVKKNLVCEFLELWHYYWHTEVIIEVSKGPLPMRLNGERVCANSSTLGNEFCGIMQSLVFNMRI